MPGMLVNTQIPGLHPKPTKPKSLGISPGTHVSPIHSFHKRVLKDHSRHEEYSSYKINKTPVLIDLRFWLWPDYRQENKQDN